MISIINYGMGNIKSIQNALKFLGFENQVTNSSEQILNSEKLILPGVGSFAKAMNNLNELGILNSLNEAVVTLGTPILGICLGMQLFADEGDEDGPNPGLGWIPGKVRKLTVIDSLKIPHIGFNSVEVIKGKANLFNVINQDSDFYFVHSYVFDCKNKDNISSYTEYGEVFASSIVRNNIFGTQFHPEKSQSNGLKVIKNFALYKHGDN